MRTLLVVSFLAFAACSTARVPMSELIVGHWNMKKVILDKTDDVTSEHNPEENRFVKFKANHTYESGGDPYGPSSGKWTLDRSSGVLHIDSDAGEDDDSYWIVTIDGDKMHWQGTHFEFNSRFAISYIRDAQ